MDQQQWQEFLTGEGAIWEGPKAHFPETEADLHLIDLSSLGAIAIKGPDSQKFLQGQLTCDLVTLPENHSTLGAHCNPKGRMISAFSALKLSQQEFVFRMPRDLINIAREALAKYSVFFKTELTDISDNYRWLGLQGKTAFDCATQLLSLTDLTTGAAHPFDLNGERAIVQAFSNTQLAILVPNSQAQSLWQQLKTKATPTGYDRWQQLLIEAGIPQLYAATSELFIPQMTNLHLLGGVSFKKGCYTGQEVIARMQFRGAAKRRLYRAICPAGEIPTPGQPIYGEDEQSIGNLVDSSRSKKGIELLAVLTIAKVAAGEQLRLADGRPLALKALPYDADADPLT